MKKLKEFFLKNEVTILETISSTGYVVGSVSLIFTWVFACWMILQVSVINALVPGSLAVVFLTVGYLVDRRVKKIKPVYDIARAFTEKDYLEKWVKSPNSTRIM